MTISLGAAVVILVAGMSAAVVISFLVFRRKYRKLTGYIGDTLDDMISGKEPSRNTDLETLSSKLAMKVEKLGEVTRLSGEQNLRQKQEIQGMVSDISHQLKTPIANIMMYSDTVSMSPDLGEEDRRLLSVMENQVNKLDFLVRSLVKMSRLESNLITLKKENTPLFQTISGAVSSVLPKAEKKKIQLEVHCPEALRLFYDPKWTEEAIFNVLDNAVKYTPDGGKIVLDVDHRQMYTRIRIRDTGTGIDPEHINDIFKRFYREEAVRKEEGVGIGLYLTREILMKQSGYIMAESRKGEGSTFSLFLSNERP